MSSLEKNYISLTEDAQIIVKDALVNLYYNGDIRDKNDDLQAHLILRLERDRKFVIPWIDAHHKLSGTELLEIGSGTGASTLAYAEQGALVTGIDIIENSLKVAEIRCNAYGYSPQLVVGNAMHIDSLFPDKKFGIAVFHASLEHMTFQERITSLQRVWEKIENGGILVIVETPNRLWHTDSHTSLLPFFHWLPDDLAFEYAKFSSRKGFCDIYTDSKEQMLHFLRRGRGVSFHEFEIAFGDIYKDIQFGKSLHEFLNNSKTKRSLIRNVLSSIKLNMYNLVHIDGGGGGGDIQWNYMFAI
jgi:S-adenosylmethionine-dependent methyltransferase